MMKAAAILLLITEFLCVGCATLNIENHEEIEIKNKILSTTLKKETLNFLEKGVFKNKSLPPHKRRLVYKALKEWILFDYGKIKEGDKRGKKIVEKYWKFIVEKRPKEGQWTKEKREERERKENENQKGKKEFKVAWSAAFISYVIDQAEKYKTFYYSPVHRKYINHIKNQRNADFHFYDLTQGNYPQPNVADIICLLKEENEKSNNHCEIIVGTNGKQLLTISGNQGNSVDILTHNLNGKKFSCEKHSASNAKSYNNGGLCVLLKNIKNGERN